MPVIWWITPDADAVTRAWQRAVISGTQLSLVVTAQVGGRVLSNNGLDRLIPICPPVGSSHRRPRRQRPRRGCDRSRHHPAG